MPKKPNLTKPMRRVLERMQTGASLWRSVYDGIWYDVLGEDVHRNTARALVRHRLVKRTMLRWKGSGIREYLITPAGRKALKASQERG